VACNQRLAAPQEDSHSHFFSISSGFQAMADVAQKLDSALGTTGETIIVEGVK
jgi:hypothetical protein